MPHKDPEKRRACWRAWRARNAEHYRDYQRERLAKAPEKARARYLFKLAIQRGELEREPCLFCDHPTVQGHHHDYTKPFEVTWLCAKHHGLAHRTRPV